MLAAYSVRMCQLLLYVTGPQPAAGSFATTQQLPWRYGLGAYMYFDMCCMSPDWQRGSLEKFALLS